MDVRLIKGIAVNAVPGVENLTPVFERSEANTLLRCG